MEVLYYRDKETHARKMRVPGKSHVAAFLLREYDESLWDQYRCGEELGEVTSSRRFTHVKSLGRRNGISRRILPSWVLLPWFYERLHPHEHLSGYEH